jgi:methionyl-tRNA formyltransferase
MSKEKFKIGYFADGQWSHNAFELISADTSLEVAFIVPRVDSSDNTLYEYSQKWNIPYYKGARINSPEFYSLAQAHQCDLFVSMSFNQIFKPAITHLPEYGTINCHAGKLPFYRGRNILNWVLINGDNEFGITVHFIDEGIDTGDILLQRTFPITLDDNYSTLLEIAHKECALILYDGIKMLQAGNYQRIAQKTIHNTGFYCGVRTYGDEIINWNQNSLDVYNFIRAICSPGPKAHTSFNQQLVKINSARLIEEAPCYKSTVGQIVGKTNSGFIIKTTDSTIEIFDIESDVKLKIGDRLGL